MHARKSAGVRRTATARDPIAATNLRSLARGEEADEAAAAAATRRSGNGGGSSRRDPRSSRVYPGGWRRLVVDLSGDIAC
uniref:DUF834 domain-containing protein n=1 Tax=Oryza glumipatula TaxID=40148 RepID=A0A0E0AVY2_9ORYZ